MSEFKVQVVQVDDVQEHPNADRLTIVKIGGYNCIANKREDGTWRYEKGDLVVYIPEAAVLPEWLLQKMGFWKEDKQVGTLNGKKGNRVKAIKLRDVVSQGVLYPVFIGENFETGEKAAAIDLQQGMLDVKLGQDVAEALNIVKYEPPIPVQMAGVVGSLHGYTKTYDIENLQKYPDAFEEGEYVTMTEKLHGTYCQIGFLVGMDEEDKQKAIDNKDVTKIGIEGAVAYVTSKGLAGKGLVQKNTDGNEDNLYVKAMNKYFFSDDKLAERIIEEYSATCKNFRLYIMGEIIGIGVQDLGYGMKDQELRIFDVYLHDLDTDTKKYLSPLDLTNFCIKYKLLHVANLYSGPFSQEKADEFRSGQTVIGKGVHIREGVVIRPHKCREHHSLPDNRLQLKYVSPEYLLRKNGTEHN